MREHGKSVTISSFRVSIKSLVTYYCRSRHTLPIVCMKHLVLLGRQRELLEPPWPVSHFDPMLRPQWRSKMVENSTSGIKDPLSLLDLTLVINSNWTLIDSDGFWLGNWGTGTIEKWKQLSESYTAWKCYLRQGCRVSRVCCVFVPSEAPSAGRHAVDFGSGPVILYDLESRGQLASFQALYRCLHIFTTRDQPQTSIGGVLGVVQVLSNSYFLLDAQGLVSGTGEHGGGRVD